MQSVGLDMGGYIVSILTVLVAGREWPLCLLTRSVGLILEVGLCWCGIRPELKKPRMRLTCVHTIV